VLHLILVRHGETEWNVQRRYQGQTDVPLSAVGRRQAELLAEGIAGQKVNRIYSSDLERSMQTANAISEKTSLSVILESRLREMNFGVLEGLTFDEGQAKYPEMIAAWLEDYNQPPQGGEKLDEFTARIVSLLDDLKQNHNNEVVLLVAHGGSLGELLRLALGLSPEGRQYFEMENASLSEIILYEEHVSLRKLNDTCHLKVLDAKMK
jgi:broad specificity phosphatase PhoE